MRRCPSCAFANRSESAFCIQCGFPLSGVTADETDERLPSKLEKAAPGYLARGVLVDGKYEIEKVLGEGGMGVVYLARDIHTEMQVVVKAIRAQFVDNPEFRARTLAEGRALARIDHPNVVRLNAVVVEPKMLYLVMQFIDGEPLDRLIERHVGAHTKVPVALALSIFRMILKGVGAAHAEGLIHRDIKPANILIRKKDGVAKVTDFGIAKGEEDAKAGRGVTRGIIGSLSYMAPEQVRGRRDLDKRVDIYALGIVLFEMLAGYPPFDAPSDLELMRMQAEAPLPKLSVHRPDAPAYLDHVLGRACAKDRELRFSTTDDFLAAIDAALEPTDTVAATQQATEIAPHPSFRAVTPAIAVAPEAPWVGAASRPPPRVVTEAGASLPPGPKIRARRRPVLAVLTGTAIVGLGALGIYLQSFPEAPPKWAASRGVEGGASSPTSGSPAATSPTARSPAAPTAPPSTAPVPGGQPSPLGTLAGAWKSSSNRDYTAVLAGDDTLEFRIQRAAQHPRQGYEDGDVRFKLMAIAGKSREFAVEDHIRPTPPPGTEYDPRASRESCVAVWTSVKGRPLLAQYDGASALTVDLVQIRTGPEKFEREGKRITGCVELGSSPAEPIESKLNRAR